MENSNDVDSDIVVDKINAMSIFPFDVVSLIISFIGNSNNSNCNLIDINNDITSLYSINNHYHNHRKEHYNDYYYSLSKEYSYRFYNDKQFRSVISIKVQSMKDQLSLDISSYPWNMTNLFILKDLHRLNLSYCLLPPDISSLSNIKILDLSCTNVKDISSLLNVIDLNIYCCRNISEINNLSHVEILNIRGCSGIKSLVGLKAIKQLNLCYRQTELIGIRDLNNVVIKWTL